MNALAKFDAWIHEPAPAERLAALRIAIGTFVVVYLAMSVREVDRMATRDPRSFEPVGIAHLFDTPLSATTIWLLFAVLMVSGLAFTAGVAFRLSGPVFALLVLGWTSYHSSWGTLLHFEHLFTIHVIILALAPAADAWAFGSPTLRSASERYGWPIRLLALATAATYVLAGIAKLRLSGWAWFDSDTLANHIGYSATRMETIGATAPPLAVPVLEARWLLGPMAAVALAVELGAPLALASRRVRNVWVLAALLFHAGTGLTMFVFFGYRGLGFALLPLFHLERIVRGRAKDM